MEYLISRSMEISRLTYEEMLKVQTRERNIKRCLYPSEIQEIFGLPSLKERYQIPDHEGSQGQHAQYVRGMMRQNGLIPKHGDLSVNEVDEIHRFDSTVKTLADDLRVDFTYRGGKSNKKRISDEIE